jgi:hypothetical protein
MTASELRRPLPAMAFIAALCLLTALVWFRVLHRTDGAAGAAKPSTCPSGSTTAPTPQNPTVLPIARNVSVLVLNSTQRNGLATATKKALQIRGFKVTQATNDVKAFGGHGLIKGVAEIRYGPSALSSATLLRFFFPTAAMKLTNSSSPVVTVSLGARFTRPATPAEVRKALAKAHVTVSAKPPPAPTPTPSKTSGC